MLFAAVFTLVYGLLILAGGIMGYVKAQSVPSLVSGVVAALIALPAAWLLRGGARSGVALAAGLAVALSVFGGKSFLIDHKPFMPRGLIFVLSLLELAVVLSARRGG
ncbi:MAG: TMEM14 family protein [Armatimonadetes bacterium]|nr:TMEM14 family protein [Armatimonadota bacterium]